jgi:2-polyprenyl-3-methyl-5-hydroxy-6-metoxy-1,4-benzoquinol methylase
MIDNIGWNKKRWGDAVAWEQEFNQGYAWGGIELVDHWLGIHVLPWIPQDGEVTALEIACGMGRLTDRLIRHVQRIHAIDLSEVCVQGCQKRFADNPNIQVSLTDGKTLPEGRFHLIVSFDSLVHADFEVLSAYIQQAPERLIPGGAIVLHHANHSDLATSRMNVDHKQVQALIASIPELEIKSQTLLRWTKPSIQTADSIALGDPVFIDCVTVATRGQS